MHLRVASQLPRWAEPLYDAEQMRAIDGWAIETAGVPSLELMELAGTAVARAAKPLQRYRCAACGFEAQHYFWQCPGCLNWDSYPPQRIDAL